MAADYEPMPSDWERGLAVVAHPDDLEYGASAAIARWVDDGKSFVYVLASRGEAGIDGITPQECGPLREREQIEAARIVGVSEVEFLDHRDGVIEYGLPLRRDLAAAIRRHRPELVVTLNHAASWSNGSRNSPDHRNVGEALLDAVGDAGNRWIFPELGLEPWNGVRWVAVAGVTEATHAVAVESSLDRGVASLEAHRAYLEGLGDGPMSDAGTFLRDSAREAGERFGGRLAVAFEVLPV
ncbi:PIG-L deacetylase family protein [Kibdelosporangium phytohabitans]|uniref:GlcNAc-PI de-N-acetylase n=1 Tax=Kibdelosporangium phytohabitans TaxID=860235 RepID=A0A0N9I4R4_9PSEU|nr:PIG-L deacetylase family protein [Kibdelosporangium phytohabitans]ALG12970.1 GlcNAc-PI de-N-acetylase [Kibdelosporangium phytohabitans]MBE1464687.1 LmbE family N-acetylglucosaminyl deacetylase [Kibdelosporangium phytohabitans]